MNKNKKFAGFTLIELLVVIVIIGILATISIATFKGYFEKARLGAAKAFSTEFNSSFYAASAVIDSNNSFIYNFNNNIDPETEDILNKNGSNGLYKNAWRGGTVALEKDDDLQIGKVLNFNMSQLIGPISPEIKLNNSKFTTSFWFKTDNNVNHGHVAYPVRIGCSGGAIMFNFSREKINLYLNTNHYPPTYDGLISGAIKIGKWHHVVGSYDGDTTKLWIDGKLVGENSGVGVSMSNCSSFVINFSYYSPSINGYIKDLSFIPQSFDGQEFH